MWVYREACLYAKALADNTTQQVPLGSALFEIETGACIEMREEGGEAWALIRAQGAESSILSVCLSKAEAETILAALAKHLSARQLKPGLPIATSDDRHRSANTNTRLPPVF